MVSRFLVWVGAGVTTAGLSLAMLAGAGHAIADTGTRRRRRVVTDDHGPHRIE